MVSEVKLFFLKQMSIFKAFIIFCLSVSSELIPAATPTAIQADLKNTSTVHTGSEASKPIPLESTDTHKKERVAEPHKVTKKGDTSVNNGEISDRKVLCCCCCCRASHRKKGNALSRCRDMQPKQSASSKKGTHKKSPKQNFLAVIPYDSKSLTQDEEKETWRKFVEGTDAEEALEEEKRPPGNEENQPLSLESQGLEQKTFYLQPSPDKNLSLQLKAWCEGQGWHLIWEATHDYPIQAELAIQGRLDEALELIIDAYHEAQFPLKLELYLNQRIAVISDF